MVEEANRAVLDAIAALRTEMAAENATTRAAVTETRVAVMDRIDRLQGVVEQLRTEMTVNWATADTAIRRVRGAEDEARGLYELVAAMQREIQVLSVRVDGMQGRGVGGD
jgi:hypothetical protein